MNKFLTFIVVFLALPFLNHAQNVENIRFRQENNKVIISYDLTGTKGGCYEIDAYYSSGKGSNFYPIKSASGDIGDCIRKGKDKKIVWNVLKDKETGIVSNIRFKIVAGRKEIEDHLLAKYIFGGSFGISLNYGRFKSEDKNTGYLVSLATDHEQMIYERNQYLYHYFYSGMNIGLMHKLVNNRFFDLIFFEQIGLYKTDVNFNVFDYHKDSYVTFPFPAEAGLILNSANLNLAFSIRLYNNDIEKIKNLEEYEGETTLPPKFNTSISLGIGWTF